MNNRTIIILILLLLILVVAGYFTFKSISKSNSAINEETKSVFKGVADEITYTDLEGNTVTLEQYLGKILVVSTWASWSPYSAEDLVALNEFASSYPSDEVIVLSINRKESKEQALRYLSTLPETNSLVKVIDLQDHFYNSVGGYAMPETMVFDSRGEIELHQRGKVEISEIDKVVNGLLYGE